MGDYNFTEKDNKKVAKYRLGTHYHYNFPKDLPFSSYLQMKDDIAKSDGTYEKVSTNGQEKAFILQGGKPVLEGINTKKQELICYRKMPKEIIKKYNLIFIGTSHLEGLKYVMDKETK